MRALPLPSGLDVLTAVLLAVVASFSAPRAASWLPDPAAAVWVVLVVVACLAVLGRSRAPLAAVLVLGAVLAVHLLSFAQPSILMLALAALAAWTSQSRLSSPWRWLVLAALYLGALPALTRVVVWIEPAYRTPVQVLIVLLAAWTLLTTASLAGAARRRSRERVEHAIERAEMLQAQQDAERRLAVSVERTRIARDVHDLLGHSLAVIGMQAAGAQAVLRTDPQAAEEALAVIGGTARRSIEEVRELIDVLREDGPRDTGTGRAGASGEAGAPGQGPSAAAALPGPALPGPAPTAPDPARPGLDELPALVSTFREAGMEVDLDLEVSTTVPQGTGSVLYDVVREALTNVARHAPGNPVRVEARASRTRLEVDVSDAVPATTAEAGRAAPACDPASAEQPRRGYGLEAMRSRVDAVGGRLSAGPSQDRPGWQVVAVLPVGAGP